MHLAEPGEIHGDALDSKPSNVTARDPDVHRRARLRGPEAVLVEADFGKAPHGQLMEDEGR